MWFIRVICLFSHVILLHGLLIFKCDSPTRFIDFYKWLFHMIHYCSYHSFPLDSLIVTYYSCDKNDIILFYLIRFLNVILSRFTDFHMWFFYMNHSFSHDSLIFTCDSSTWLIYFHMIHWCDYPQNHYTKKSWFL